MTNPDPSPSRQHERFIHEPGLDDRAQPRRRADGHGGFGLDDAFWLTPQASPLGLAHWFAIGLEDVSTRYFAIRSAPPGGGPNELMTSAFFGWNPSKIDRYLPVAKERTTPEKVLRILEQVADQVLDSALGDWVRTSEAAAAATMLRKAAELRTAAIGGRRVFAGCAALAWPDPTAHHLTFFTPPRS